MLSFGLNLYAYKFEDCSVKCSQPLGSSIKTNTQLRSKNGWAFKTNNVAMTNITFSLVDNPLVAGFIGNISYITTTQLNTPEMFYSFVNVGNKGTSIGVGFNFGDWYGGSVYVSDNIGFGFSAQITPLITIGGGVSLTEGISFSAGLKLGDTTHEISVNIGWGTVAGYTVAATLAASPIPGVEELQVL